MSLRGGFCQSNLLLLSITDIMEIASLAEKRSLAMTLFAAFAGGNIFLLFEGFQLFGQVIL